MSNTWRNSIALLCLLGEGPTYAAFIPLGDLPGGLSLSDARGVSADGSVVVGTGQCPRRALRHFAGHRRRDAKPGVPAGDSGLVMPRRLSERIGGGRYRVGSMSRAQAFRWTQETGIVDLGFLPVYAESRALKMYRRTGQL